MNNAYASCFQCFQVIPQMKKTDGCSRGAGVLGKHICTSDVVLHFTSH